MRRYIYGKAPEQYHFVLSDRKKLKKLTDEIDNTPNIFKYNLNNMKNNFSLIKNVLNKGFLAEVLNKTNSRIESELALNCISARKIII